MVSCRKCGRENPAEMRFCTNCGEVLPEAFSQGNETWATPEASSLETLSFNPKPQTTPTTWPNFGETYKQQQPHPVAEGKKSKTGLIVGVVITVLLLGIVTAGAGVGYYYYSKDETEVANGNNNRGVNLADVDDKNDAANKNGNTNSSPEPKPSPTTSQNFAPPTEATKEGTFTVYANEEWQLSQIAVVPKEEYTTRVEGIVDLAGAKAGVRPGGTSDAKVKSRRLFQEWPTGALLMRTRYADGRFSNTVAVAGPGTNGSWENLPDERGMLEFRINDNAPQDNGGQFTIRVKMTRVPKKQ